MAVVGGATAGRRSRGTAPWGGVGTLAGAACERRAIFQAGRESARDPKYAVVPPRRRLEERRRAVAGSLP